MKNMSHVAAAAVAALALFAFGSRADEPAPAVAAEPAAVEEAKAPEAAVAPEAPAENAIAAETPAGQDDPDVLWFQQNGFDFPSSAAAIKKVAEEIRAKATEKNNKDLAFLADKAEQLAEKARQRALKDEAEARQKEIEGFAAEIDESWSALSADIATATEAAKDPIAAAEAATAFCAEKLENLANTPSESGVLTLNDAYYAYLASFLKEESAKADVAEAQAKIDKAQAAFDDAHKDFVNNYADNVQKDAAFKKHIADSLTTMRQDVPAFGTFWAIFPPLLAIILALITKEVYSSLFIGIVSGGLIYSKFSFEGTITHVMSDGFISSIADGYNIGILIFLVLLGALVAMMNKTGASAAFGRWAAQNIKSRVGAQLATIVLGMLIFVDDYFNCLTVGSVMKPVAKAKKVSSAKLAYLIDATAAPICIIAPISSWAAAVAGFAAGAGAESGFSLFINAIPYNFYAILTIVMMLFLAFTGFDFGLMKKHEEAALEGHDLAALEKATDSLTKNDRGRVYDLIIPVVVLVAACVVGMIYSGGYFGEDKPGFIQAFSDSDASVGLVYGSIFAIVFAVIFYLCRRVISFKDCMDAFPEGFKAMVPAIMILCCAWTLKAMTDSLGAKVFISDIINSSAASLKLFLPAIIFLVACFLAFASGTSWGTFGILIPIVLAAMPGGPLTIIAVSACMAGAVCGDHCSPISDTTIMASAGAQCNHVDHVNTQLPYAVTVAAVSFVCYIIAGVVEKWQFALPISIALMVAVLFVMRAIMGKRRAAA